MCLCTYNITDSYHMVQNFDSGNFDNLTNGNRFIKRFPINFSFITFPMKAAINSSKL